MTTSSSNRTTPIICLEGASAIGKTTLAAALARECGAALVPELDASDAPPVGQSACWFVERHAAQWRLARASATGVPFAMLDGDPFKGLWYNWTYAGEGWEGVDVVAPLYRAQLKSGALDFPDLYVILTATQEQLRQRRDSDPTRRRRNFEKHLRIVEPQRRYFAALREAAPSRVVFMDSSRQSALVSRTLEALRRLPSTPPDSERLLDHITDWLREHAPTTTV